MHIELQVVIFEDKDEQDPILRVEVYRVIGEYDRAEIVRADSKDALTIASLVKEAIQVLIRNDKALADLKSTAKLISRD